MTTLLTGRNVYLKCFFVLILIIMKKPVSQSMLTRIKKKKKRFENKADDIPSYLFSK